MIGRGYELPPTDSKEKSVVFITMHKAGSVFTNRVIRDILARVGLVHVDFERTAFSRGIEENVTRHKRQILPGDYKRKLKIETQQALTRDLQVPLERFGYLGSVAD